MLLRPPKINQQHQNTSRIHTESDDRQSTRSKNKNKIKQSSLSLKKYPSQKKQQDQLNNQRKQIDNQSINSHGSARSKKSKKKQTSIGAVRYNVTITNNPTSIHRQPSFQQDLQVMNYLPTTNQTNNFYPDQYSQIKANHVEQPVNKPVFNHLENKKTSSFKDVLKSDIPLIKQLSYKKEPDDEITVVKLEQKKNQNHQNYVKQQTTTNSLLGPKMAEKKQTKKLGQIFQENRKNYQNQLAISGTPSSQPNTNSLIGTDSKRSKSKLGQLFKQSNLQKQLPPQSHHHNFSPQIHSIGRKSKQKSSTSRQQIIEKIPNQCIHQFQQQEDLNKEDLNLSMSKNSPFNSKFGINNNSYELNAKDSLCFVIEPEKKKGLKLTSKMGKQSPEMIKISGSLHSKDINELNKGKNMDAHERLKANIKQNQKSLQESGALNPPHQVTNPKDELSLAREQQLKQKEETVNKKLRQLERQQQIIAQKNNQQKNRMQQERQVQKKRQQDLKNKQEQWKRKEQIKRQQDRIREEQRRNEQKKRIQYKKKIQQQEKQKKLQLQQQKEQHRLKQIQDRQRWQEQNEKIRTQRQKLKKAFPRNKQQLQFTNSSKGQSKSIIQTLQQLQTNNQNNDTKQQNQGLETIQLRTQTYSRDNSIKASNHSSSISKKSNRKKQTSIPLKTKNKKLYTDMSPRAQASFYQQSNNQLNQQQPTQQQPINPNQQLAPRNLISFTQPQDPQPKISSKTDTYFYTKNTRMPPQPPPSSKPPISKKSSISSSSKNKIKQSSIQKKKKNSNLSHNNNNNEKKLSIMELAMRKNYQGSGSEYQSQDSYRSRDNSGASVSSKKSNNSKGSYKKQSVIPKKQKKYHTTNINDDEIPQILQSNQITSRRPIEQQNNIRQINYHRSSRSKQRLNTAQRTIIKDCSFIDEKGRLVQRGNLIVSGNKVSGTSDVQFSSKKLLQRMMNSRQARKSRSRQRSLNRSNASSRSIQKLSNTNSNNLRPNNSKYVQSQAYSQLQISQAGRSYYQNSKSNSNFYGSGYQINNKNNNNNNQNQFRNSNCRASGPSPILQQFIKPIHYENLKEYNDDKEIHQRKQGEAKKKSMRRTEKYARKG